jgi:hypothetical protein
MTHKYTVEPADNDIDCPLFRQVQLFLQAECGAGERDSLIFARTFMRRYWLNLEPAGVLANL